MDSQLKEIIEGNIDRRALNEAIDQCREIVSQIKLDYDGVTTREIMEVVFDEIRDEMNLEKINKIS